MYACMQAGKRRHLSFQDLTPFFVFLFMRCQKSHEVMNMGQDLRYVTEGIANRAICCFFVGQEQQFKFFVIEGLSNQPHSSSASHLVSIHICRGLRLVWRTSKEKGGMGRQDWLARKDDLQQLQHHPCGRQQCLFARRYGTRVGPSWR